MKKKLSTLLLCMTTMFVMAQSTSNLVIFSEDGYKFYLVLNGIRQNETAQTNVRVTGLNQPYYNAEVIFEDKKQPTIYKKNVYVVDVATKENLEATYKIKKNNKLQNVMRFYSSVPVTQAVQVSPQVVDYQYNTTPMPEINNTIVTQQVTSTTTTGGNANNTNVTIGTNGLGMGVNINVNAPVSQETITTTTTTYSTSTSSNNINTTTTNNTHSNHQGNHHENGNNYDNHHSNQNGSNVSQQNNANCTGAYAMTAANFTAAKNTITKQSFDETKLSTAKLIVSTNCLTAAQIKELLLLFSFEETRLTLAKEAHARCIDKNNYFLLNDAFNFSSSVEELNNSIK